MGKSKISDLVEFKTLEIAGYIIMHRCTLRQAADAYCVSKSSAHLYMHKYLPELDRITYDQVCEILNDNWSQRQRRGGLAVAKCRTEKTRKMDEDGAR